MLLHTSAPPSLPLTPLGSVWLSYQSHMMMQATCTAAKN